MYHIQESLGTSKSGSLVIIRRPIFDFDTPSIFEAAHIGLTKYLTHKQQRPSELDNKLVSDKILDRF